MDYPQESASPQGQPEWAAAGPESSPAESAAPVSSHAQAWRPPSSAPGSLRMQFELALPPGSVVRDGVAWVPAGLQPRIYAFLLDMVVLSLLHSALLALAQINMGDPARVLDALSRMMEEALRGGPPNWALLEQSLGSGNQALLGSLLGYGLFAAYFTFFHGFVGTTLGKGMLGLRVLRREGSDLRLGAALLRYIVYFITAKLAYTAWLIPFDSQRRALHDIAAGTNVFRALALPQASPWQAQV